MNGCDVMPQEDRIREIDELNAEAWEIRSKDIATAHDWAQRALSMANDTGYAKGQADSLSLLGYGRLLKGELLRALEQGLRASEIYRDLNDAKGQVFTAYLVSQSYRQMNDFPQALEHALPYVDIAKSLNDTNYYIGLLMTIGGVYLDRGDYDSALSSAYEMLKFSNEEDSPVFYADSLNNVAYTYYLKGHSETALAYSDQALAIYDHYDSQARSLDSIHTAGVIRMDLDRLEEARMYLEQGLARANADGIQASRFDFCVELGRLSEREGNVDIALDEFHKALRVAEALDSPLRQADAHHRLAQLHKAHGNFERALHHHEEFHQLNTQIFNERSDQHMRALQIQHEVEQAQKQIESYRSENVSLQEEMERRKETEQELRRLAARDPLTGVYNRQHVERQAGEILKDAGQAGETVGMILIDLDGFKAVNDSHGHPIGDTVLRELTKRIQTLIRANDILGRYGGDEFVVVLRDTSPEQCQAVAERIRHSVDEQTLAPRQDMSTTVSIGIVHGPAEVAMEPSTLLERADDALYAAKQAGKNRIRLWDESIQSMAGSGN